MISPLQSIESSRDRGHHRQAMRALNLASDADLLALDVSRVTDFLSRPDCSKDQRRCIQGLVKILGLAEKPEWGFLWKIRTDATNKRLSEHRPFHTYRKARLGWLSVVTK